MLLKYSQQFGILRAEIQSCLALIVRLRRVGAVFQQQFRGFHVSMLSGSMQGRPSSLLPRIHGRSRMQKHFRDVALPCCCGAVQGLDFHDVLRYRRGISSCLQQLSRTAFLPEKAGKM